MKHFTSTAATTFTRARAMEGAAEIALAGAAALFTATCWLSIGTWAFSPETRLEVAMAHQPREPRRGDRNRAGRRRWASA